MSITESQLAQIVERLKVQADGEDQSAAAERRIAIEHADTVLRNAEAQHARALELANETEMEARRNTQKRFVNSLASELARFTR